jgi:uncharacterized membrane protein
MCKQRIIILDFLRGCAIIMMTLFHFTWDLEFFGLIPSTTSQPHWVLLVRVTVASFLCISGMSFAISHQNGTKWHRFWRRFALLLCAAMMISAATFIITPNSFVFFGILHHLACVSLIAVLCIKLPARIIFVMSTLIIITPYVFRSIIFATPMLWWSGLAPVYPPSNDYVPFFPWAGFFLLGLTFAKTRFFVQFKTLNPYSSRVEYMICFFGRHSLLYYLLHQPIIMAIIGCFTLILPYF